MTKSGNFLKIDIGCGSNKKPGCIGIDCQKLANIDFVLDLSKDKLPFDDKSVDYIFASHFLEHIKNPNHLFSEISRVAINGARLEIWTPYAHSDDAFCYGHEIFYAEEHWQHICIKYPDFYIPIIGARWLLEKITYVIDETVFNEVTSKGFDIEFAIKYFKGVVREFGIYIKIEHDLSAKNILPTRYYSFGRFNDQKLLNWPQSRSTRVSHETV